MITFLMLILLSLLGMALKENYGACNFTVAGLLVLVILVLLIGNKSIAWHHKEYTYEKMVVAIWVPFGAVVCYILSVYAELGSVLAAGIVGTLASFIPELNKQSAYLKKMPPALYCGAFVGMSSVVVMPSIWLVLIAGCMTGVIYILAKSLFLGMGGKLGTMAFGGVIIVAFINWLV